MKKLLLLCMMALGIGASAQIIMSESFEGTTIPSGWASSVAGTGTSSNPGGYGTSAGTVCAGSKAVYKNLYGSTYTSWFMTYSSTASNATALNYSFKYLAKGYSTSGAIEGTVSADYSIDGGTTWVEILAPVTLSSPNATPIPCTTVSGTIPAGTIPAGASFKFRLKSTSTAAADFYMGFDDVQLAQLATTAPACTTVSAPASAATNISVTPTITWASASSATSYKLNMGTTPGGTDIMNGLDVGNTTSYAVPSTSSLSYSTTYYLTVLPVNNIGTASGCTETSFTTTTIPCPSVSAPSSGLAGVSLTPTITWTATSQATGYRLRVGTTAGGSDVLDNIDLGNVTSYTFATPLSASTKYYYVVNSYNVASASASCTERDFTTVCGSLPAPYSENFNTGVLPGCWTNSSTSNTGYALWRFSGTPDYGTTNNGSAAGTYAWVDASSPYAGIHDVTLTSPQINLAGLAAPYVEFKWFKNHLSSATGTTLPSYDNNSLTVEVKEINASAWTSIFTSSTNSAVWRTEGIALPASYIGTTIQVRFIVDKDVAGNGYFYDNVLLDDVEIKEAPTCLSPSAPAATNVTALSADLAWTAPATAPGSGYDIYFSTTNTAPVAATAPSVTGVTATSYTLSTGLAPSTTYYVWVRSRCSANDQSDWVGPVSFTTTTFCPVVTAPAANEIGTSVTPTITWDPVTGATGYKLTVGTTAGGTNVLNNIDLGNVTSYTFATALANSTQYYYTVNAYNATVTSSSCSERSFTTVCAAVTAPFSETFSGGSLPSCWTNSSTSNTGYALWRFSGTPDYGTTNNGSTAGTYAWVDASSPYDGIHDVTLTTPQINLAGITEPYLKFKWFKNHLSSATGTTLPSYDNNQLTVEVKEANATTWTTVFTSSTNSASWRTEGITLPASYLGTTVQVRFIVDKDVAGNGYFYDNVLLDDIEVNEKSILGTSENTVVKNTVKIYPNPFVDELNISDISKVKSVSITDISGKLVKTISQPASTLYLNELISGMYLVTLEMKDGSKQTFKAIKR
ncbi:fibronectin type III domain-containing protein [Chryseobacterium sp. CT-SW4]|uniref:fibronectin type III domain-containing protein n=1 Tax=Chryseobacterium sp. SW-1 TaxID=3157343 RepID=UPI003B02494F